MSTFGKEDVEGGVKVNERENAFETTPHESELFLADKSQNTRMKKRVGSSYALQAVFM